MEKLVRQIVERLTSIPRPKNWVLKLLSLLFGLFLWYFVVGEDKVDMTVTIPVEIVNLPRELVISNQFKKQLEVTVSGQRSLIRGMTAQHISRTIDLSDASPGTVVVQNRADSIGVPRGLSILRLQPPTITLLLDRLIQKEVTIEPVLVGKVHEDYRLVSVSTEPPTLEISGPQAVLGAEQQFATDPIDISDLKESGVRQVSLALEPEIADLIGEPVVAVHLNIAERQKEMEFPAIAVELDSSAGRQQQTIYQLLPPTVAITAAVPQPLLKSTPNIRTLFHAQVSPETLAAGTSTQKVLVSGPPQAKILAVEPPTVSLKVTETPTMKIKP